MATPCTIGIELHDEKVNYIYCHWDGYPSTHGDGGVGYMLLTYYNDADKARRLIRLGNLSSLAPTIEASKFYIRDLSELAQDNLAASVYKHHYLDGALKYNGAEYRYLFTLGGEWQCRRSLDTIGYLHKVFAFKRNSANI